MSKVIEVGGKKVGDGHRPFVVVETSVTHEGNFDVAQQMVAAAARAGADALKCECILADRLVAKAHRGELIHTYVAYSGKTVTSNYYEMLKPLSLTYDQIAELKRMADKEGLLFFSTAFDLETVDFLKDIGACAIKLASCELRHLPLVRHAAHSGLPVFIDTGLATIDEIARGARIALDEGAQVALMHNPSGYPAPPSAVNLRMIPQLKEMLGIPVGLSCHSRGNAMAIGSVCLGADIIEKPVTVDNTKDGIEHIFSVNLADLSDYVQSLHEVYEGLGTPLARMRLSEGDREKRAIFDVSVVTSRALEKGHLLAADDMTFGRAGWGLPPEYIDTLVGAQLLEPLPEGHVIQWKHVLGAGHVMPTVSAAGRP